ncbi:MAG: sulfatase-like hydrolase/transferase [Thermoguttaceae bacterium]
MPRQRALWLGPAAVALLAGWTGTAAAAPPRPNILWITCEDTGPQLGCYGDPYAQTPNLDRLAARGLRYRHVWSNAPVCAPARTAIITGVYPSSTGSEHMRSLVEMPAWMKMYPQFLRERGYYCTNNSKEDYNLQKPPGVWDESSPKAHWKNRSPGQPFFAVFNITVSHESQIRARPHTLKHDPAQVRLPAYHPDTPEVRRDWAQYYDKLTEMDAEAGKRLAELEQAGLADQTIVFFYGDHGSGMPRSKRWPYDSGLHVPLLVYIPEKYRELAPGDYVPGGATDRLVGFVDLAPTLLSLAGIKPPAWMEGRAFLGPYDAGPQPYLFGLRGRMDERYDMVRSVRNQRYIYVRNYMPHLIYGQHVSYMFQTPTTQVWKRLYDAGKLAPPQTFFWEPKPAEELYDLQTDPDEVRNLVDSPGHQQVLKELRAALREHLLKTRDAGFLSEAEMHRRAAGTTIYEMARDPAKYPLEEILAMAELAASRQPEALARLVAGLEHPDSAVRYWAATGLLVRGAEAVGFAREPLRAALRDSSPSVQAIAAWALGQYGSQADLEAALGVLKQLAPPDKNGAYVAILAVNVIDALGPKAAPLHEFLRTMPVNDPKAVARANGYVARLRATILGEQEKQPVPKPKRSKREKP